MCAIIGCAFIVKLPTSQFTVAIAKAFQDKKGMLRNKDSLVWESLRI
ncbi:hypothetical protein [Xanthocytophaga agilis]|uniref:Uncharacterized protein n=1 Tax=Xanthocytophaga agilis TaxID=3048010 RepID=A0AAE3UFZ4_9BACT|nr:hypothetical protein [Xanthocytophaga agilis]MDJ1502831.1 hypothetical protein [Xanthocytophaga agilis]